MSCSGGTTERISSIEAGFLIACPAPSNAAAAKSSGSGTQPTANAATTAAVTAARTASVTITITRPSYRSASTPAGSPASSMPRA